MVAGWVAMNSPKQKTFINEIKEGYVVFDIGAHVGFYTLLSSQLVGEQGQVVSFEPFPPNLSYLKRHIQLNKLKNVKSCRESSLEPFRNNDF